MSNGIYLAGEDYVVLPSQETENIRDLTHNLSENTYFSRIKMIQFEVVQGRVRLQLVTGTWLGAPPFDVTYAAGQTVQWPINKDLPATATIVLTNVDEDGNAIDANASSGSSVGEPAHYRLIIQGKP